MHATAGFAPVPFLRSALAVSVVCLVFATLGDVTAIAQATDGDGQRAPLPVGNDAFTDVTIQARIARRFEIYNPHSRAQLQTVKDMGFTQVILDWPNLHTDASEIGLDVVMAHWWTLQTEIGQIEKGVDYAKQVDPRRLVALSMMDEPERYAPDTPFSFYQALYRDLRSHFDDELPHVKLEISHWGPLASWTPAVYEHFIPLYQAADRIRLMPYPDLFEGPLSEVYYQMLRSRRLMELAGHDLPQVVILQTWVLPENPKLPTIPELRVMAYVALLTGADTLSFFNYDPQVWRQTDGFQEGFSQLMRELTEFSRQHQDASVETRMSPQGVLTALLRPPQGEPVSIAVNTNRNAVDNLAALAVVIPRSDGWPAAPACVDRHVTSRRPAERPRRFRRWRRFCLRAR